MKDEAVIGFEVARPSHEISFNIPRLIESRLLINANSGAGKSWALRRLLEQSYGHVQQLVIDPEGEYRTLREKFDYVLAAKDGDCAAEPASAALLCRRLLELGVSAVLDIYELKHQDRKQFVKNFLDALVNVRKDLWHNVLVVVDEAHLFAPEQGQSIATQSVIDLMTLGRKRGFCGVLATQRISKLHKDATAEALNNFLIGRCALDIDIQRAASHLGFRTQDDKDQLRSLPAGHFFAFGPAISSTVVEIKTGPVQTTHPKAGQRAAPPPPPREKIQKVLSQLADLPKAAALEVQEIGGLSRRIRELETLLKAAQRAGNMVQAPDATLEKAKLKQTREAGFSDGVNYARTLATKEQARLTARLATGLKHMSRIAADLTALIEIPVAGDSDNSDTGRNVSRPALSRATTYFNQPAPEALRQERPRRAFSVVLPIEPSGPEGISAPLPPGAAKLLAVLALRSPTKLTKGQWAALAQMAPKGGTFRTYVSKLKTAGFIEFDGRLAFATEAGITQAGSLPPAPSSPAELIAMWKQALGTGPGLMLDVLAREPGDEWTRVELANAVEMAVDGGTFRTYLSKLSANGLIEKTGNGSIRISPDLYQ